MPSFTIEHNESRPHPTRPHTRELYDVVDATLTAPSPERALRDFAVKLQLDVGQSRLVDDGYGWELIVGDYARVYRAWKVAAL